MNRSSEESEARNQAIKEAYKKALLEHNCQRCKQSIKGFRHFIIGLDCSKDPMDEHNDPTTSFSVLDTSVVLICPNCYDELLHWFNSLILEKTGPYDELTGNR
jgi:hypothetical protein